MSSTRNALLSIGFLSTPSVRRATVTDRLSQSDLAKFLSTPSVRRATV